jgi:hypothetical protein
MERCCFEVFSAAGRIRCEIVPRERKSVEMNGRELLERGLRLGVPLWRIEAELDWQENQGPHWSEFTVCKQSEPVTKNKKSLRVPTSE